MEQLDKWNKEMRRLSVAKFAETDDALYNYYKEALKSLKAEIKQYTDNYEQLSFSKRLEVENRLKTANRIDGILNDLNSWSDAEIRRYIENEIEVGYYGTLYALEGAENVQLDFGILPERYIETLVNEKVNGQTFSKLLYKKRDELAERVTSALLTSAVNGKGYAHAAKEVGELTEASYKQALRIARTEGGRAQSTAKQKAYKEAEKKGVQLEKRWLSTLDKKTRHSHQELDGQTVAVDGQFNFNGHKADGPRLFKRASLDINCRCTTVAVVNGIAPDVRADNETKETIDYKTYNEWAEAKGYKKPAVKPKAAPKPKPKPEPKPKPVAKPKPEPKPKAENAFDKVKDGLTLETKRRTFATKLMQNLGLEDVPISIKKSTAHGYCSIRTNVDGTSKITGYVLNSKDLRSSNHQLKTAFHEAYHAANNGRLTDMNKSGFGKMKWLDVEETFAETSSHYAVKELGFTGKLAPSYAERLVNTLPRLKQIEKFKDCEFITDFGKIAWEDRLDGQASEWLDLAKEMGAVDHDWPKYGLQYKDYIEENKDALFDLMLGNMPQYDVDYIRASMKNDLDNALKNTANGKRLEGNEGMIYSNILINAMNSVGVK